MLISHHSILHLQYIGWLSKSLHLSNSQHRLITITGQYWARNWRYCSLRSVHASSGSEWSSSWKYRARRRGSYSTMGTISSWPASFLPEIPALLQYWIGATSSASQSWKRISVGKVKITDRSKPSQCCRFQWCWTLWGGREQLAPGCVTPGSSHPGEKGWWRNFLRDFFFCIQHLLETWQEVVTLQGPKPPPNINTGKWYTWWKEHISQGQWAKLSGLPCIEGYQSSNKVKWLDDVEFGAGEAKQNLAQPNSHLVETQVSWKTLRTI